MPGPKTNEREGTRAVLRHARMSPSKVREVLDLVRNRPVHEAEDILRFSERDAAFTVNKLLHSAVANAEHNDGLDPEELFISACFADEGTTIKRWRPRARGRATRIRKRTTHITVIVSRMPSENLERLRARRQAEQLAQRARRVAGARASEGDTRTRAERRRRGNAAETEAVESDGSESGVSETEVSQSEVIVSDLSGAGASTAAEVPEAEVDGTDAVEPIEEDAALVAAQADEEGIVDETASAVAATQAGEITETAADEAVAGAIGATGAGRLAAEEEDQGIVDTTAGAVAANEAADARAADAGSETPNVDTTEEKDS
jgi:large subunit ribosomal protein L22